MTALRSPLRSGDPETAGVVGANGWGSIRMAVHRRRRGVTPPPPLDPHPPDQTDHRGKKRNLQSGKSGRAICGTHTCTHPPTPSPNSNTSPRMGRWGPSCAPLSRSATPEAHVLWDCGGDGTAIVPSDRRRGLPYERSRPPLCRASWRHTPHAKCLEQRARAPHAQNAPHTGQVQGVSPQSYLTGGGGTPQGRGLCPASLGLPATGVATGP